MNKKRNVNINKVYDNEASCLKNNKVFACKKLFIKQFYWRNFGLIFY